MIPNLNYRSQQNLYPNLEQNRCRYYPNLLRQSPPHRNCRCQFQLLPFHQFL
jgi:hypothetical protein